MMIRLISVIVFVVGSVSLGTTQEETAPRTFFPESGTVEGWSRIDSISEYSRSTLQSRMGEMTDLYLEYGITKLLVARYTNEKATKITLEIYQMHDPAKAWGLFTMNSSGKGSPDTLGDVSKIYDQYVHLVKGPYYIKCITSRKTDESVLSIRKMGAYVAAQVKQHAKKPTLLLALETENDPIMYGKFFIGQRGLSEIIDFGHGSVAGFDEAAMVRKEAVYHFIFRYEDERRRREWFASAKGKMKMNHKFSDYQAEGNGFTVLDRNGNTFTFQPYRNYILVVKDNDPAVVRNAMEQIRVNLDRFMR